MKKLLLALFTGILLVNFSHAQIICIRCFNSNDSISSGVNNLVKNGSFENGCSTFQYYCPNSTSYGCNLQHWMCTNGGTNTYASTQSSSNTTVPDGLIAIYMGNWYCQACSTSPNDISCLTDSQCVTLNSSAGSGFPLSEPNYGGVNGVSLVQTVYGLTPGSIYELEFWVGGESGFPDPGIFAINIGFGNTFLKCKPTPLGSTGTVYVIEFAATSASHTIKFTNWGHMCSTCTEVMVDNVRLYTAAELDPSVPVCAPIFPVANISCSDSSFCGKKSVNFYDLSTNSPTSWNWTFQGALPSTSTAQNPTGIYYANFGQFDVTLVTCNANGCDTLFLPGFVHEYQTPNVVVTQSNDTLYATGDGNSFQWWSVTDGIIPGALLSYYVATIPGEYYAVVTDSLGCQGASPNVLVTSVNELDAFKEQLMLSPNPFNAELSIRTINTDEKELIIFDLTSRQLIKEKFVESHSVNTEGLAKGTYFYEIRSAKGGFKTGKIIKQ